MGLNQVVPFTMKDVGQAECPNCHGTGKVLREDVQDFYAMLNQANSAPVVSSGLLTLLVGIGMGLILGIGGTLLLEGVRFVAR